VGARRGYTACDRSLGQSSSGSPSRRSRRGSAAASSCSSLSPQPSVRRWSGGRRFGPLFLPFRQRTHWFLLVDSSFAVITAVISGAASSVPGADACDAALWGGWLLVAAAAAQLVVHAVLRPMNCWFDLVVALLGDVLAVIGNLCAVLDAIAASTYLTLASSCVVLAASCFMIVVALAELILELLHRDSCQPSITQSRHNFMIQESVDVSHSSEQGGGILKPSAKPTLPSLEMKALLEMLRDGHTTITNVNSNLKHLIRLACKQEPEDAKGRDLWKERQVKDVVGKRTYTASVK
ncbi:transmembrane protein, putative, partial [Bodo saltans]